MPSATDWIKANGIKTMNADIEKLSPSELCANIKALLLDLKVGWVTKTELKKVQHVTAILVSPPLVKSPSPLVATLPKVEEQQEVLAITIVVVPSLPSSAPVTLPRSSTSSLVAPLVLSPRKKFDDVFFTLLANAMPPKVSSAMVATWGSATSLQLSHNCCILGMRMMLLLPHVGCPCHR